LPRIRRFPKIIPYTGILHNIIKRDKVMGKGRKKTILKMKRIKSQLKLKLRLKNKAEKSKNKS